MAWVPQNHYSVGDVCSQEDACSVETIRGRQGGVDQVRNCKQTLHGDDNVERGTSPLTEDRIS